MSELQLFARGLPYGFMSLEQLDQLTKLRRLCPVLVRCGAQCGRFTAPAQNVRELIRAIESVGDYVRDLSLPASVLAELGVRS